MSGAHSPASFVQDAFVTAFTRIQQLRDGRLFRAWLMRITVHEVHRRFRRRKLRRRLGLDRDPDHASLELLASPQLSSEQRAELAALDRSVRRCASRTRA